MPPAPIDEFCSAHCRMHYKKIHPEPTDVWWETKVIESMTRAWISYQTLFGVPPLGTKKQMKALFELGVNSTIWQILLAEESKSEPKECECFENHMVADVGEDSCGCCMNGHKPVLTPHGEFVSGQKTGIEDEKRRILKIIYDVRDREWNALPDDKLDSQQVLWEVAGMIEGLLNKPSV